MARDEFARQDTFEELNRLETRVVSLGLEIYDFLFAVTRTRDELQAEFVIFAVGLVGITDRVYRAYRERVTRRARRLLREQVVEIVRL